jgi:nucleolar protein 14
MAKRKSFSKTHSVKRLPKGLPTRAKNNTTTSNNNPFELTQRRKRPKFAVHNRTTTVSGTNNTNVKRVDTQRQSALAAALQQQRKANVFSDQRIGEHELSNDAKNLARLVRERARQSKRLSQYALNDEIDDEGVLLTHKGQAIRDMSAVDHVVLSDDEEDGDLDAYDTALHFGGGREDAQFNATYGGNSTGSSGALLSAYAQKKQDLDDRIQRRKVMKLERLQAKEEQVDHFEAMDQSFQDLSGLLQFRDKEQEIRQRAQARREGAVPADDQEYDDWDREMKQYLYSTRKVAATDRTKTPEEIAQEEAERLRQLETRRLARMNGDIDDELDDHHSKGKRKHRVSTADALDDDDDDDEEEATNQRTTRFTSEGLVYVDRDGVVLGKVGEMDAADETNDNSEDEEEEEEEEDTEDLPFREYNVGDQVTANYRAKEQYGGQEAWYSGVISKVRGDSSDMRTYNIEYDDGDFEEDVEPQYIRPVEDKTPEADSISEPSKDREVDLRRKRQKAMAEARYVYQLCSVFWVQCLIVSRVSIRWTFQFMVYASCVDLNL